MQNIPGFTSDYYNQNVNGIQYFNAPVFGTLSQRDVAALLPTLAGDSYASLEPIVNFATTPISGVIVGAIGPIVAPVLAVVDGISNAIALLQESNFQDALIELINIPANTIGAVLNGGQTLDFARRSWDCWVSRCRTITSIGLKMGGLLSPGGWRSTPRRGGFGAKRPRCHRSRPAGRPDRRAGQSDQLRREVHRGRPPAQTAAAVAAASSVAAPKRRHPGPSPTRWTPTLRRRLQRPAPVEAAAEPDDAAKAAPGGPERPKRQCEATIPARAPRPRSGPDAPPPPAPAESADRRTPLALPGRSSSWHLSRSGSSPRHRVAAAPRLRRPAAGTRAAQH